MSPPHPSPPVVSVIMPCLDAAAHVETAIASVCQQRFGDLELLVVDNGSRDDTLARVAAAGDSRITTLQEPRAGVSHARNLGLAHARGDYVAFLDADDTWHPDALAELHGALTARPDAVLSYCGWQNVGLPGNRGRPFVPPDYENEHKLEKLLENCRWPIHAALTRRSALDAAGGFDPGLTNAEDFLLWLEVAHDRPVVRVPRVLAYYHHHGAGQASSRYAESALHHFKAQRTFLAAHPEMRERLAPERIRSATCGELLRRGYVRYWARDLKAARRIFRAVMLERYGSATDWKYMLPALLPEALHRTLVSLSDGARPAGDGPV